MTIDVTDRATWLEARLALLDAEKSLQRERDRVAALRRALPLVRVDEDYRFDSPDGVLSLGELFGDRSQLIVYHFMFHPDWDQGCKLCSFWADNFERQQPHLRARDARIVAVSRAPLGKLLAYRDRLGWSFPWVSSGDSSFNFDFNVSFTPEQIDAGIANYNFRAGADVGEEMPGISVFLKDPEGVVYHSYSTYSRGLDPFNAAYQFLDVLPKGRDEDGLDFPMAWVRRNDEYDGRG